MGSTEQDDEGRKNSGKSLHCALQTHSRARFRARKSGVV
jgi:hypothetical protein